MKTCWRIRAVVAALVMGIVLGQLGFLGYQALSQSAQAASLQFSGIEDSPLRAKVGTPQELQRALDSAVQGTTIELTRDMRLDAPLEINKQAVNIKLQGNGVVLRAPATRHLRCTGRDLDILFQGITLDGAGTGGGIYSTATNLSLGGVTVQNCVTAGSGGGVEAVSGSLYLEEGIVIQNNRAAAYGGGVFTGQGVSLEMDGGVVKGNTAGAYGGGIFGGVGGAVSMDDGEVSGNQAVLGGGIYAGLSTKLSVNGGKVTANQATGGGRDGGMGGGIFAVTCDVYVGSAEITHNQANHGGGIYATGDGSDIILKGGTISHNRAVGADGYGGGIYLDTAYSTANTLTVNSGVIASNHGVRGGGVFASGSTPVPGSSNPGSSRPATVAVNNGEFRGNTAGTGGALYGEEGCHMHLSQGVLRSNSAKDGGAVYIAPLENLTVDSPVIFSDNSADTGVPLPSEEHIALHRKRIRTNTFSKGYAYGYNNLDIHYEGSLWEEQFHTVQFSYMGATPHETQRSVKHGESVGALPSTMRTGYAFLGWFTEMEDGDQYTADTKINESVTLYARWEAGRYTLTFDYDGVPQPGTSPTEKAVVYGSRVGSLPLAVGTEGKAFVGWFDLSGEQYFPATPYLIPGDLTLTAHWVELDAVRHQVEFSYNGATDGADELSRTIEDGHAIGTLPEPLKEGMVFGGWYSEGRAEPWSEEDAVYGPVVLEADWQEEPYEVRFHYPGMDDTTGLEQVRLVPRGAPLGPLPQPELSNLTWKGWYADMDQVQRVTEETRVDGALDLYAAFQGYLLFDYQAESTVGEFPDKKGVYYGYVIGVLPIPVRNGHAFSGWSSEPEGGGRYYGSTTGKVFEHLEDLPLYANWHGDVYTIRFDYQGGTPGKAQKQVVFGDNVGSLPFPAREGFRFGGWYTQPGGGGEHFFVSTPYLYADNTTLYAHWVGDDEVEPEPARQRYNPSWNMDEVLSLEYGQAGEKAENPGDDNPDTGRWNWLFWLP